MGNNMKITELDRYLFGQGTHYEIYKLLGAHPGTQRKKENRKEVLPEIHTDEEYEARLHRMLERRKAEKQRQIQRRKIVRCLPFAGMIILALVLVGIGVGRLADIIQTRSFQSSVEKMVKEGAIQAQKQPVMSGTDIEKFSSRQSSSFSVYGPGPSSKVRAISGGVLVLS